MNRKDQLNQLISLNKNRIVESQNLIIEYQNQLNEILRKEGRPMDQYLQDLCQQLTITPEDFDLRRQATIQALRVQQGIFAAWRSTTEAMPELEALEITQPLFISENVLEAAPIVKQIWQVTLIQNSITDLLQILPLQPNAIILLPQNALHYFSSMPKFPATGVSPGSELQKSQYHVLYDTSKRVFFSNPLGSYSPELQRIKTHSETNMYISGAIPHPYTFICHGISLFPKESTAHEETVRWLQRSWFRLYIGSRNWLITPTLSMGITTSKKSPGLNFQLSNPVEPIHVLPQPFVLEATEQFRIEIVGQDEVNGSMQQPTNQDFEVMAMLHGFLNQPKDSDLG